MKGPIYLTSNNTIVRKSGDYLIIDHNGRSDSCPSESISYLVKFGWGSINSKDKKFHSNTISDQLLFYLSKKKLSHISYYTYGGYRYGTFVFPETCIGKSRERQNDAFYDSDRRLFLAKEFVISAANNKLSILKKYGIKNKFIKEQIKAVSSAESVEVLRGTEGTIAASYFEDLKHCFKQFSFSGREYHPPKDPINALLSFSYDMLYEEIMNKVHEHGMDPFRGFLHEQNNNQWPLVYDISEVFKQNVDAFVMNLVNIKIIKDFHFNRKEDGACLLDTAGKDVFLKHWIAFLRQTQSRGMMKTSMSEIIRKEVFKLKAFFEDGVKYEGYRI